MTRPFADALHAAGPHAEHHEPLQLYGQFVGAWSGELSFVDEGGDWRETTAEVAFGWILGGRALQDVWKAPAAAGPKAIAGGLLGTTIRVYDPDREVWEITWIEPGRRDFRRMEGRAVGREIVQEAHDADGSLSQWVFTDIESTAFRWLSRASRDGGATWQRTSEFRLRRARER